LLGCYIGLSVQHLLPIITFGVATFTSTIYPENLCRNSCISKQAFQYNFTNNRKVNSTGLFDCNV